MAELVLSDSDENVEFEGFVVSPDERAKYAELVRKRSAEEAFGSTVNELSDDDDSDDDDSDDELESEEDQADDNENEDDLSDEDFDSKEEINGVLSDDSLDGALAGISDQCPICLMSLKEQLLGTPNGCQHVFCLDCIREWANNVNTCPVGRRPFHEICVHASKKGPILERISVEDRHYVGNDELFEDDDPTYCQVCADCDREDCLLLCDNCDNGYHMDCLAPPLEFVPIDEWFCPACRPHHVAETHDSDTAEEMQCGQTSQARLRSSRAQQNAERGSTSTQVRATSSRRASARTVASVRSNRTAERRTPRRGGGRRGRGRTKSRTGSSRRTRSSSTGEKRRKRKTSKHRRKKSGTRKKTRGTKKTTRSRAKRQKKEQDEPFFELQFAPAKRGRTVRARLHESLGPSHSTGGEQVRNPGRCSLPSRLEPSVSFAVFGNSFALYDFNKEESAEKDEAMTSVPSSEPGNPDVLGSILEGLDTLRSEEVTRDGHMLPQRLRKTPTTSAATSCTANSRKVSQALMNQARFDENDDSATKSRERSVNESANSSLSNPVEQQRVSDKVSTQMSDFALFRLNRRAARSSGSSSSLSTRKASAASSAELAGYKIPRKISTPAPSENLSGCVSESKCTDQVVRPTLTNECKKASSSSSIKWNVLGDKKPVTSVTGSCAFASERSSDICGRTPSANRDEKLPVTFDRESVRFLHQSARVSATDKKVETAMDRIPDSEKSLMERESVDPKPCSATKGKLCAGDLPSLKFRSQSYSSPFPGMRTSQSSFPDNEPSTQNRVAFAPPIHQRRDNLQIIQMLRDKRENMMAKNSIEGKGKDFARNDTKLGSSFLPVAVVKPSWPSTSSDATSELSAKSPTVVLHSAAMQKEESGLLKNCKETRNGGKETKDTETSQENERDKQRRLGIARLSRIQQIADEVRLALKPYYKQSVVNKEEYKNIMRRAVEKIRNSQSGVDRTRVCSLVEKYVKKVKAER